MYIPKNRLVTNLTTLGGEFIFKDSFENYQGNYWKTFNGKFYSGKNPNDTPYYELVKVEPLLAEGLFVDETLNISTLAISEGLPIYFFNSPTQYPFKPGLVADYATLQGLDFFNPPKKILPTSFYPKPTEDDYNLGVFTRYFCVKANENIYIEISKDTYDALNNQKGDWMWQLFTPFKLLWTISGEEKEVEKTNYNVTIIREKRLKRRGLTQFLRNNYLKFYPSPYTTEDVMPPTTEIPTTEDKPSIKDLFKIVNPTNRLMITPEEIENAKIATPTVTSSIGNPLTGIEAVFDSNQNKKKGS